MCECMESLIRAHDPVYIDTQAPSENDSQPHVLSMERSDWLMIPRILGWQVVHAALALAHDVGASQNPSKAS